MNNLGFRIIIYFIMCVCFFSCILGWGKMYEKIEPYIGKHMPQFIPYCLGYPIIMFIMLIFTKLTTVLTQDNFMGIVCMYIAPFYLLVIVYVVYGLIEMFGKYIDHNISFWSLLLQIFLSLFSIVLCFGFTYSALHFYDISMFSSIKEEGLLWESLQFIYYSFKIMLNTDVSETRAEAYISQGFTILESLTSFLFIAILLANYEKIGKVFKNFESKNR